MEAYPSENHTGQDGKGNVRLTGMEVQNGFCRWQGKGTDVILGEESPSPRPAPRDEQVCMKVPRVKLAP